MTIEVDHRAFRTAVTDVRRGADDLHTARDSIDRDVEALLDEGWSGLAAESFAEGWGDWRAGADAVLAGLVAMARLLDAVHVDLTERDLDAQTHLDRTADRIVARLGS